MAFIPDDAEDRFNELSPSAERFYIYLCRTRNHKTKQCYGTIETCAEKYNWSRTTKFAVQKELVEAGWIKKIGEKWVLLVGDFSPVDKSEKSDSAAKESEKSNSESEKSDYQSEKSDSHIRNIPASLPADLPAEERECAREPFPETQNLVSEKLKHRIDETLHWIQTAKRVADRRNFPASEWIDLIAHLIPEGINTPGKFKDFYLWVENLDWVVEKGATVSPNLLKSQIEKYKRRDEIAAKRYGAHGNGKLEKSEGAAAATRSNSEKVRNRDYSKYDGFDPIKTFG